MARFSYVCVCVILSDGGKAKKYLILPPSSSFLFAGPTSSKAITLTATRQWPEVSKEQRQTASAAGEQLLANLLSPSIIHGALEKISSVPPVCLIWQCNSGLVTEILNLSGLPFSKETDRKSVV